jgi:hypothetical protein
MPTDEIAEESVLLFMQEIEVTNNMTRIVKESLMTARICNNLLIIGVKYGMFMNIPIYVNVFVSYVIYSFCDLV